MSDESNIDPTENFEVVTNEGAVIDAEPVETQDPVQQPESDNTDSDTPNADKEERGSNRYQKRIDRLTKRASEAERLANEERQKREELEQRLSGGKKPEAESTDEPDSSDFDSYADYLDALAAYNSKNEGNDNTENKAPEQKEVADVEFAEALEDIQASFADSKAKYPNFDELVNAPDLAITNDMVKALSVTDDPTSIAYYLANNKTEAARIAGLKPLGIAREFGRIETKLAAAPTKRVTAAPDPISPVSGSDGSERAIQDMDFAEYEATMNKKEQRGGFW